MELRCILAVVMFIVGSATGDSGFLVTAPQKLISGSTEKVCATFFELQEVSLTLRIKHGRSSKILLEISERPTEDDLCVDLKVPSIPSSSSSSTPERQVVLQAEVIGRSLSGSPFIETHEKNVLLSSVNRLQTYIQTDKPIYKAGQKVKFRILSLIYPEIKPYTLKVRRVYVEEPGGRRVQQWSNVDTRVGLADMEMLLSAEPPLGIWTIFAAVGSSKVRQTFEVGEYVLPKFSVNILPQPTYIYRRAEDVNVKICAEYSYGEPVKGSVEANLTLISEFSYYPRRPVVSRTIDDTGSDGCHLFSIDSSELELNEVFDENRGTYYKLQIEAAFTEHGTDVTMAESAEVGLTPSLYNLVIDGPNSFKPGLPYHGKIRLTYPDKFPVSNKDVKITLENHEGGEVFSETITTSVSNGVGSFTVTPPRNAANTKLKIRARVVAHEGTTYEATITANKYVQAWFSPSGSFLQVAPMPGGKQDGQQDNIEVAFTAPTDQQTIAFHYKIMSRSNVVHSGRQTWMGSQPVNPVKPVVPVIPTRPILPVVPVVEHPVKPDVGILPIPRGQLDGDVRDVPSGIVKPQIPHRQRFRRRSMPRPRPGGAEIIEPDLPTYKNAAVNHISLPFNVSTHMAPTSKVVVYYIRTDGEVVSGSSSFTVAKVFENQVSLDFNTAEAMPGASMQLTVNASPQSLCALGVVDKSVHLLRDSNQLTASKVQSPLQSFNTQSSSLNPSSHCSSSSGSYPQWRFRRDASLSRDKRTSPPRPHSGEQLSKHLDAIEGFKNAGMIVITNFEVETRPCYTQKYPVCYHCYGRPERRGKIKKKGRSRPVLPERRSRPVLPEGVDDVRLSIQAVPVMDDDQLEEETSNQIADSADSSLVQIRSYFPETWLWMITTTSESGTATIDSEVPHTITDWVANGFCTSGQNGFGIADPVELRAFQPFFLSYNLPYSAIREEKIPVDVTVFNYLSECFTVELSMEESNDFSLLDVSRNKYVCVCDRESKTVNFTIIPRALGDIKITVHGNYVTPGFNVPFCGNNAFLPNVDGVRDAIEDTLLIEPEGVEREETFSEMVCVEENDTFNAVVPLNLPPDVIPDSARGRVYVTGDLMGSVLSNLDSILKMPTGCGEQNMIKFAPNIYVLQYLTNTDQLSREIETKALEFLRVGYQRELTYRLNDGSYSAFGQSDGEGSTWLTAFVLKSFVQANMFIDIDTSDIVVTRNWLLSQQKVETGCFRNRGQLRQQSMKGGVSDEVTLTAYVLIALLEAGVRPDDSRVILAEQCITARLTEVYHDPYGLALVSYALLLAENPDGQTGLRQLDTLAHTESGGVKYWKFTDSEPIFGDGYNFNTQPSASVEMTSYALLAYMVAKDLSDAIPIVRWLNQQRSALGGYSSTQDTVMGLQSLAEYASEAYSNETNMAIDVSKVSGGVFLKRFVVDADNKILQQRMELDEVPTTLNFDARGKGCALIQAQLKYNVPAVRTIRRDPFNITLDMSPTNAEQHCGKKTITTCVRYVGTRDATNMAAVEFKMVTGYVVEMESLSMYLQKHGQSIGLKRVDPPKKGEPLVLYFDQFDSEQRCFEVEVKQNVFVDGAKPASIKVYDYYEPGVKSYMKYNTCPPKEDKKKQL